MTATLISLWLSAMAATLPAPTTQPSYYVAPGGMYANDGSKERPWPSVEWALQKVGGGKRIVVRPGKYAYLKLYASASGTADKPTVIVSEEKHKAVITGPYTNGIFSPEDDRARVLHDIVIDGFAVDGGDHKRITSDGIRFVYDQRIVVRNCWVHDVGGSGVSLHQCTDSTLERSLIEGNGVDAAGSTPQRHGVYADGERLTIRYNEVRRNSGWGLHLYDAINDSLILKNTVTDHPRGVGIHIESAAGGGRNRVLLNVVSGAKHGIAVRGGENNTVVGNEVRHCLQYVLLCPDTAGLVFEWNLLDCPVTDKPEVVGTNEIRDNLVEGD